MVMMTQSKEDAADRLLQESRQRAESFGYDNSVPQNAAQSFRIQILNNDSQDEHMVSDQATSRQDQEA